MMLSVALVLRHVAGVMTALLLALLVGCAGTVRQDPQPRAFVISENGYFYPTYGTRPPNPNEPTDPTERAMKRCLDAARPNCAVYAQDDRVVYARPAPTATR